MTVDGYFSDGAGWVPRNGRQRRARSSSEARTDRASCLSPTYQDNV